MARVLGVTHFFCDFWVGLFSAEFSKKLFNFSSGRGETAFLGFLKVVPRWRLSSYQINGNGFVENSQLLSKSSFFKNSLVIP